MYWVRKYPIFRKVKWRGLRQQGLRLAEDPKTYHRSPRPCFLYWKMDESLARVGNEVNLCVLLGIIERILGLYCWSSDLCVYWWFLFSWSRRRISVNLGWSFYSRERTDGYHHAYRALSCHWRGVTKRSIVRSWRPIAFKQALHSNSRVLDFSDKGINLPPQKKQ